MIKLEFNYFTPLHVLELIPEGGELKGFPPISSIEEEESDIPTVGHFMHNYLQFIDLCEGLHFAEKEIIPAFKKARESNFADLQPEQIITLLKQLHGLISPTLALGVTSSEELQLAGEYSPMTIMRWQKGRSMEVDLAFASIYGLDAIGIIFEQHGLKDVAQIFINIMNKVEQDNSIIENEHHRLVYQILNKGMSDVTTDPRVQAALMKFNRFEHKLCDAVHQNKLTPEDLGSLQRVVKVCLPPEKIPPKMMSFATKLIKNLQQCDGSLDAVAGLGSRTFRKFTKNHPFFNANGRESAILMCCLFATFDKPCILYRSVDDKLSENSTYSKAIESIDTDGTLWDALIKRKLEKAVENPDIPIEGKNSIQHESNLVRIDLAGKLNRLRLSGFKPEQLQKIFYAQIEILEKQLEDIMKKGKTAINKEQQVGNK